MSSVLESATKSQFSYPTQRNQSTKINSNYSSWEEILFGVPCRSILGPLLFNTEYQAAACLGCAAACFGIYLHLSLKTRGRVSQI